MRLHIFLLNFSETLMEFVDGMIMGKQTSGHVSSDKNRDGWFSDEKK